MSRSGDFDYDENFPNEAEFWELEENAWWCRPGCHANQ